MKLLSGLSALLALSMFLNATDGVWAFDRVSSGAKWVVLDLAIGAAFLVVGYTLWRIATTRDAIAEFASDYQGDR
jgi:hypothetical protein